MTISSNESCYFTEDSLAPILAPVILIEFIIGLLGNATALWIFCFCMKSWKPSIVYLFNLSLADFLLIFCLPFRAAYYILKKDWQLGDVPCRIMLFMVSLNRAGSIVFLTVVALDRYFRVVHPHHRINMTTQKGTLLVTCLMWCLILAMTVYLLATQNLIVDKSTNKSLCESFNLNDDRTVEKVWHDALFVAEFLIPLCIIFFCTFCIIWQLKSKVQHKPSTTQTACKIQKAVYSVSAVAIVFVICFLPSICTRIAVLLAKAAGQCNQFKLAGQWFYATLPMTYLNSVLDPVVFYCSSSTFKESLKQTYFRVRSVKKNTMVIRPLPPDSEPDIKNKIGQSRNVDLQS
ncbi:hydroxycarboxylic acid receptor 3-like [Protopterus annectens]|uniref:hydroxycarboxylic acid receptor 3-like n=1 Tax=Protopterus annectens TaxID=7888 RepID=UPI001CFA1DF9|nr:hydroxycarboxylic acid receptor 3-like [Protopterus annectens]